MASCQTSSPGNGSSEPAASRLERFEASCRSYPNSESEVALRCVPLLVQNEFTLCYVTAANQRGFYERKNYKIVAQEAASIFSGLHVRTQTTCQQCGVNFVICAASIRGRKVHAPAIRV